MRLGAQSVASTRSVSERVNGTAWGRLLGWPTVLAPGEVLGSYRIDEVLGVGGMGIVYGATHPVRGAVVIKVLRKELAAEAEFVERMHREAKAAAALQHPNIVTTYEFFVGEAATFIVMERLSGETLGARLGRERTLSPIAVASIGVGTLSALGAAHAVGLVHRDVKPDNLFLCKGANGRDIVKLLDFGLVKGLADEPRLTKSNAVLGTLQYMAPEQARGDEIDGRADIYALGSTLYFALTGKRPHRAAETDAASYALLAMPAPPIHVLRPKVPAALAGIIERAIEKDLLKRYASALEMARDLRSWLESVGEHIDTSGDTTAVMSEPISTLEDMLQGSTIPFDAPPVSAPMTPVMAAQMATPVVPQSPTMTETIAQPKPHVARPAISHTLVSPADAPAPAVSVTLEAPLPTPPLSPPPIAIGQPPPPLMVAPPAPTPPAPMPPAPMPPAPTRPRSRALLYMLLGVILFFAGLLGGRFLWAP
jgi:eukaryotic-like serine/threonine-protein kinase